MSTCELCRDAGGIVVARGARWRVVRVADDAFPAFYRVIWDAHAAEFTDLAPAERAECMDVVACVERALRNALVPTKINLASLGNMVPHLHWHVIARFEWDSHFPGPIWGEARRTVAEPSPTARLAVELTELDHAIAQALANRGG